MLFVSSQSYVRKNFSLAWPLALNALLMQSMLMIDTLLVSPLGEIPLAAMGIATTIIAFVLGIQMALANGTQLVLSRAVGSGVTSSLSKAFWAGLFINVGVASMFWILLTFFEQPLIQALTDDKTLHLEINHYLDISKYLVIFTALTQVIIALFNGLGRTKVPFKGYLIELPVNAVLSYVLIYGFSNFEGIGVQGAALGSVIAITVRLVYLILCVHYDSSVSLKLDTEKSEFITNIRRHFIEIFPVAANVTMLSIGATIYQLLYSQLNINAYVAITLVMPWIRAGTQFITAWAHSSAITISQAIGSKKMDDLTKNVDTSIDVAVGISVVCAVMFAGLSLVIGDIYSELDASTYQALAVIAPLYIFLPIVRGYNTVHGHVLRALGKTTDVFKINFTGQWVISIPLCALIIFGLDGSIFWAFAIQPFEEIVKAFPFRHLARKSLKEFDASKAKELMYD
ncbi:MATE family efflux transporter [Vibrio splendidus]|uniref:MATE family efflux transporter n=1 Tax=Vibrio splendidus TaxID=29497 RepID=UPI002068C442|nr:MULTISPECIES: MATE family efflux transporter [Vibrio]UPR34547.1 polysaccharide biosynthesis C-terminal domain-containing protein [Vibrio cyclitrophicus]UPR48687.1 polysaccharide biosynthesis C-terminal domain-containing protein [Vibrio cyclitrophicus]UWZ96878.1 polysaccharide biosynthesis C-terminal domain-containing protein [Vibrio splendidus]